MAVKHIVEYFNILQGQKQLMDKKLEALTKEVNENLAPPELLDRLKDEIKPLMNNYQTICYIIYLLNKPVRKQKQLKYNKASKKILDKIDAQNTLTGKIKENEEVLNNISFDKLSK